MFYNENMNKIIKKEKLNDTVVRLIIEAPLIANKAKAGQFVIIRVDEIGERIPLTIADSNKEKGTISIIFQIVGYTTEKLNLLNENDYILDVVGPLGEPSKIESKNVIVIGGGVGCAIALPVAKAFKDSGAKVTSIIGFRNVDIKILEKEFDEISDKLIVSTDDGSYGIKGNVTLPLLELLKSGEKFDEIITIGPLIMMKFVVLTAKEFNVPVTVSMNPIMIDGTGMCGCCRLSLIRDGKKITKFACVDGPDFNGYEIDFDEAIARNKQYLNEEKLAREKSCSLFKKEIK